MNELSAALFAFLQLILLPLFLYFGFWRLVGFFFPNSKWLKQFQRKLFRLMLVEPIRKPYQAARWLIYKAFTTERQFRLNQLYLENYPAAPLAFYDAIEEVLAGRQVVGVSVSRVTRLEWHLLSARRIYLLITFRDAACFIGAATLGTSFLISWRYTAMPGRFLLVLFQIPFLGVIAERLLKPPTFYRADVYHAFEQAIRAAVLEATDMLTDQGARPLAENEQRPLLREFYEN